MELVFGYLEFIKYKAEKSRAFLTIELTILTETKYHYQIVT